MRPAKGRYQRISQHYKRLLEEKNSVQKAKNRLVLLYSVSMGVILSAALLAVFLMNVHEQKQNKSRIFQSTATTVYMKLSSDTTVSNTWITEMESSNEMILHIVDAGKPLIQWGSWVPEEEREKEVTKVENLAREDNLLLNVRPISQKEGFYRHYQLKNEQGHEYYAVAFVIPFEKQYRSAILIQYFTKEDQAFDQLAKVFLLIEILGILCMVILNQIYVRFIMKPVEESKRLQTEFIAAASHELKAPLTVIRTSASAIKVVPEKSEHYIATIGEECNRMSSLVEDLLILSSTETKAWRMVMERVELDTILLDVYEEVLPICKEATIGLAISLPDNLLPPVNADAMRLKQIIVILLNNAVQYSKSVKPLLLHAYTSKHYVYIQVIDYGIGIPDEEKTAVFEKFYQVDSSHNDRKHYGLGLSIARELVKMHQGLLLLEDTEGGGCTFTIKLPRVIED
ncbi:His Kinase A (phospho-acceptor) domain-containing protein [Anaerosporobacter mobilis DSM 15930]|uniref:histidine kinase n=1 Tax=Anaerosporobacter mobilis DSM 15930 TaxID=1120996 RepID=A0A1M7FS55_9FIRM|nr:HAMP domain-containing sensor histidine kinase [Anaerosporobacter mobilis]SHM06507.1 His Kinase A (phospho-acceptor) domain-containing protein [Anaerosporobacter mobilis DSM 15930]